MKIGLGIDTGGTYTDGVLYDFDSASVVAREKRLTTPHDLSLGIAEVLGALPPQTLSQALMVSLSTTLATNACVEGKGGRAALLLLGYDEQLVDQLRGDYGIEPDACVHVLPGSHTQKGAPGTPPDYAALRALALSLAPHVDAFGVAEYWGLRNPEYEIEAKRVLREATGLPVAAAHELSAEINSMRRAATTLLNARLIPLTERLMAAVHDALAACGVSAPLMIVRGDGTLMTEAFARECPVETLLSGPAASVVGGMKLAAVADMIAVDIGGTTTDLAIVRGGSTQLARDGVNVGEWRTGTRAIEVRTVGLGGDSRIAIDREAHMTLGPQRALPLSCLAQTYPDIKRTLADMIEDEVSRSYSRGEFITLVRAPEDSHELSELERRALSLLEKGPLSVEQYSLVLQTRPYFLDLRKLESLGLVLRSALTLTDMMHITGEYSVWDAEAAHLGARLLAQKFEMDVPALVRAAFDLAGEKLYTLVCEALLTRTRKKGVLGNPLMALGYRRAGDELDLQMHTSLPLVALGAPAYSMLPRAAERLHTSMLLPAEAGVANAVGAITGSILAEETVVVKPHYEPYGIDGYSAHSSEDYMRMETQAEIIDWARKEAERVVRKKARAMGAQNDLEIALSDENSTGFTGGDSVQALLLEVRITARGLGKAPIGA